MTRKLCAGAAAFAIAGLGSLLGAAPASAHSAGPCDDSGEPGNSDYAAHHIVALAHDQALGDGGHKPGSHAGFSLCLGVH